MPRQKIVRIDELPEILTLTEAGMVLGYSEDYLRKQAKAGRFPAIQLFEGNERGSWRVFKSDMLGWLDSKRQPYTTKNAAAG